MAAAVNVDANVASAPADGNKAMRHDLTRRCVSVGAGVLLMVVVGSNHAVSAWNAQLQRELQYSQSEIAFVCSMASFGAYFSVTPGYVFDRIGAHNSVLCGALLLCSIYLALATGIVDYPNQMHPLGVGVAFAAMGQATNFGVFAALGPNEGLFGDRHRGKIMALELAAFSAGGALFALVYQQFFHDNVAGYFTFMALLMLSVFVFAYGALYRDASSPHAHRMTAMEEFMPPPVLETGDTDSIDDSVNSAADKRHAAHYAVTTTAACDITGAALLRDSRFWLLFATVFILVGSSLFVMANIAFIVGAHAGNSSSSNANVSLLVALFSIANCVGRLSAGIASDVVLAHYPRVSFVSLAAVLVAATHALFLVVPASWLALPIALAGAADGVMFAAFPVLVRETFGAKHFGANFGLMSVANAIGFPLFYNPLGSLIYKAAATDVGADGNLQCVHGAACFAPLFALVIALSGVAFVASRTFAKRQAYTALRT